MKYYTRKSSTKTRPQFFPRTDFNRLEGKVDRINGRIDALAGSLLQMGQRENQTLRQENDTLRNELNLRIQEK